MQEPKRALITGIHGFTGKYMASEIESAGYEVFGTAHGGSPTGERIFDVDLCDPGQLRRLISEVQPTVVVHLAAISFIGHGDPNDFYRINLIGTRNLLEALASEAGSVRSVLLASSAQIYGNGAAGVVTEATEPNPASDYAVSKLAMEAMARLWLDKLPLIITRPFNYIGVGQNNSFLLPKIVAHFQRRAPFIELGNLDVWRDFSDVRAVATAYRKLIEIRAEGLVVNVCSGMTHSLREVIAMAENITGHKMDVRVNPAFVRANEVKSLCGDASRLRSLIGEWGSPPLEDTLRWMLTANE